MSADLFNQDPQMRNCGGDSHYLHFLQAHHVSLIFSIQHIKHPYAIVESLYKTGQTEIVLHEFDHLFANLFQFNCNEFQCPVSLTPESGNSTYLLFSDCIKALGEADETFYTFRFYGEYVDMNDQAASVINLDSGFYLVLPDYNTLGRLEVKMLESLSFPAILIDSNNRLCAANSCFNSSFLQVHPKENLAMYRLKLLFNSLFVKCYSQTLDIIKQNEATNTISHMVNGTEFIYELSANAYELNSEAGYLLLFQDVTLQKSEIKELKRKKHQLEESQRIAHVGSWEVNFETNQFYCSEEFFRLTGYSDNENFNIKRFLVSTFPKSTRNDVVKKYFSIFNSDLTIYQFDVSIRNQWGREVILSDTGRIVRDIKGLALRNYATVHDISEVKKTTRELLASRETLTSLLKALPDRVFMLDSDGIFVEYYDNLPSVVSSGQSNFKGFNIARVFGKETSVMFMEFLNKTLVSKQHYSFEYTEGEGLFERWYEVRTSMCNSRQVVFLVREITQTRKSTQELLRAKKRAEESDNLKSSFLANISHEIRTPLNAMMGFSNILVEENLSAEEKEKYLGIINRNGDQLTSLFSDLLDISKIESGQLKIYKEQISVNEELDKLYHQFVHYKKQTGKAHLELKLELPLINANIVVIADQTRFIQVFSNLLTNALKFTDEGHVTFGYMEPEKSKLKFFVKDSGKGVPKDEQTTIFKRFRQSETNIAKKHGGTGLGLAISESLVNLMGGRIWVESEPDKGAIFWFTLPF